MEKYPCPFCEVTYTQSYHRKAHICKKHPEMELGPGLVIQKISKRIKCPNKLVLDLGIDQYEYAAVVKICRTIIKNDMKKVERFNPKNVTVTKRLHQDNTALHQLVQKILKMWLATNPERYDMLGGQVVLQFAPHSTNLMSCDRITNNKPHFLSLVNPFENMRIVPLKLNTAHSLIQLFGKQTREKVKELIQTHRDIDVDVESQIRGYANQKKNYSHQIYRSYCRCKSNNKGRYEKQNRPVPQPASYELFQEQFLLMLRKQKGRCAISRIPLNYPWDVGPKQFQISVDRINPNILSYWDFGNLQLVCLALNVTDHSRVKKYVHNNDSQLGAAMDTDWFNNYFDI